jgi:nucleotide-binding universal stress UspA family protein
MSFGETASEVLKLAAREDAQLIVVGAHSLPILYPAYA